MDLSGKLDIKLTIPPIFGALMSRYTSFRTGGPADCLVFPVSDAELARLLAFFIGRGIPYTVLGRGTNVLVADGGVEGAVIYLSECKGIETAGRAVTAKCGTLLSEAAAFALNASLGGLECLSGIPGSVGGGVCMNAGAYGSEMKDVVSKVTYVDPSEPETVHVLGGEALAFDYRKSFFTQSGGVVTSVEFSLAHRDKKLITEKMRACNAKRREKQPLNFPSAGSAFKRPPGYFAAQLIDSCGLKGRRIGGASVSEKHAGFIVNDAHADVAKRLDLIALVQKTVLDKTGVTLEPEIKIIGRKQV
jgi:UDP-N-acetylmuramate dehydrogenase